MKWKLKNSFLVQINNKGLGSYPAPYFCVSFSFQMSHHPCYTLPICTSFVFHIFSNSSFLSIFYHNLTSLFPSSPYLCARNAGRKMLIVHINLCYYAVIEVIAVTWRDYVVLQERFYLELPDNWFLSTWQSWGFGLYIRTKWGKSEHT